MYVLDPYSNFEFVRLDIFAPLTNIFDVLLVTKLPCQIRNLYGRLCKIVIINDLFSTGKINGYSVHIIHNRNISRTLKLKLAV